MHCLVLSYLILSYHVPHYIHTIWLCYVALYSVLLYSMTLSHLIWPYLAEQDNEVCRDVLPPHRPLLIPLSAHGNFNCRQIIYFEQGGECDSVT